MFYTHDLYWNDGYLQVPKIETLKVRSMTWNSDGRRWLGRGLTDQDEAKVYRSSDTALTLHCNRR